MKYDAIVAGAGIWGCTVARKLAESGRRVLVLEKRPVVGGNVRCEIDPETGIEVHIYGSHIFHTHNDAVWEFVNRFTMFNGYQHKVLTKCNGKTYFMPIGLTLVNAFFGVELKPTELQAFLDADNHRAQLFDAFIRGYTSKQWGTSPENIDPSIIKRIPVRENYDVNYFTDYKQGIPSAGYNALFDAMLMHPNIKIECNVDWLQWKKVQSDDVNAAPVYYSGPIDALFDYKYGALPWRSLRFERERIQTRDFQGTSVMNYADIDVHWTRIHEYKHFHPENKTVMAADCTVICREFPMSWKLGDEPYYAVENAESRALLSLYRDETQNHGNLIVGGRLGEFKYYDMDQSIARALDIVKTTINEGGK